MIDWSSLSRRNLEIRMELVRSVMSKHNMALPRLASVRDVTAITSPSTATLPDSSVSVFIGTVFSRSGLPMRILPVGAAAFGCPVCPDCPAGAGGEAAVLSFTSGAGNSAWMLHRDRANSVRICSSSAPRSVSDGAEAKCTRMVMVRALSSTEASRR